MSKLLIILENCYSFQIEIDGKKYGKGSFTLTYYGVVKFRVNHDFLVITVRDGLKGVHKVYVPIYMLRQITFINGL